MRNRSLIAAAFKRAQKSGNNTPFHFRAFSSQIRACPHIVPVQVHGGRSNGGGRKVDDVISSLDSYLRRLRSRVLKLRLNDSKIAFSADISVS